MIEDIIPEYIIAIILSYLNIYAIKSYDTAITNRINRPIFLNSLQMLQWCVVSRWSFLRNIKSDLCYCKFNNLKYVHELCSRLVVYSGIIMQDEEFNIDISNDSIVYLHIDFLLKNIILNKIRGNKIESITMCNLQKINVAVFVKLTIYCPSLKTIRLINCSDVYLEDQIIGIVNSNNIKISVK